MAQCPGAAPARAPPGWLISSPLRTCAHLGPDRLRPRPRRDSPRLPAYRLPTLVGVAGESEWYETQLGRLGAGKDVHRGLHPLRAASAFVGGELVRGLTGRRRRARLVAAAN